MKILFGIPPKHHSQLAIDEMNGLRQLGVHCDFVIYGTNDPDGGSLKKLYHTLKNSFSIIRRLNKNQYDFLYLSSRIEPTAFVRDFITLILLKTLCSNKILVVIKSHGSNCSVFKRLDFFYKYICNPFLSKNIAGWFILSNEEIENISSLNRIIGGKTFLIPNIVSLKCGEKDILGDLNIPLNKFKILFAGRLVEEKGIFDLVNSISSYKYLDKSVFIIAGSGPEEHRLKDLCTVLGLDNYVQFVGLLDEVTLDLLYKKVDILAFPSHDEGFSMVLFKAVASGLPVITTRIRAAKDYLSEPSNVLWTEIGMPLMLSNKLNTLYNNKVLRDSMSKNNVELGNFFTIERVSKQLFENFIKLCP